MDITEYVISQREEAFLGGGYEDYRAQNSRRLHTLRRRLGVATPKGRKYTSMHKVTVEEVAKNQDYTHLLLLDAERAWASAMAMKAARVESTTDTAIAGSTRSQIISRLTKATFYAGQLTDILKELATSRTNGSQIFLDAEAYRSYLRGALYFEKGSWTLCLRHYAVARVIYQALATKSRKDSFKELLSTTIDPSLRYAAYQSKLPRTKPISEVSIEYFPAEYEELKSAIMQLQPNAFQPPELVSADGRESKVSKLRWRTRTVNLEDAAISEALVFAESAESKLLEDDRPYDQDPLMSLYDDIITARQEVVDATKTAIDEMLKEGVDQSDPRIQSLQITRTAVNYALIEWRVGRDRLLCGQDDGVISEISHRRKAKGRGKGKGGHSMATLRKVVAQYDAIMQSLDAVGDLPGVASDSSFVHELKGKSAYFRALRCLAVGRSHAIQSNERNALALFNRASELSATALKSLSEAPQTVPRNSPKLVISRPQLVNLNQYAGNLVIQYRALAELHRLSAEKATKHSGSSTSILGNLEEYVGEDIDLTKLVVYPPEIEPIPVKPLFFDLAWNYIDYPGRTTGTTSGAPDGKDPRGPAEVKKEAKKGWFGFGR